MNAVRYLFQDWSANRFDPRARFILVFFRLAHHASKSRHNPLSVLVGITYRLLVTYLLGVEIPWKTQIGPRLRLYHGVGLVVNDGAVIGADVTLRHCVTIGHLERGGPSPIIEDGVEFGANCVVLGPIRIGSGAKIGAGSVVIRDVDARTNVAGNPARPLHRRPA